VERVSDHAVNLAELAQELAGKNIAFSAQAMEELRVCVSAVQEISQLTQKAMLEDDFPSARMVEPLEDVIDDLTQQLKTNHIQRLQAGQCTLELGFIYNDCINNFERVADHCSNIAVAALESADASLLPHDYLNDLSHGDHADYRQQVADYRRKYLDALTGQA
jgi:phosphate:Na+ symporter